LPVTAIHADVVEEGRRLLALARGPDVPIRLLGGVAIRLRAPEPLPAALDREYKDIDLVTSRRGAARADELLREAGYAPHVSFNALHGKERMLFFDDHHGRQVDVFVGAFSMSHRIPLADRIETDPVSVPLAELLLTKLQIAELNEKDVRDALALLHGHPVASRDGDAVNGARIASLCCSDWGLWRTITGNLGTALEHVDRYELGQAERDRIADRGRAVLELIEDAPKSRAWKLRARIGERKRWYEIPEEVAGGP
jgi:hypothetical protein